MNNYHGRQDNTIMNNMIISMLCTNATDDTPHTHTHTHTHDDTSPNQVMMSALDTSLLILIDIFFTHVR